MFKVKSGFKLTLTRSDILNFSYINICGVSQRNKPFVIVAKQQRSTSGENKATLNTITLSAERA